MDIHRKHFMIYEVLLLASNSALTMELSPMFENVSICNKKVENWAPFKEISENCQNSFKTIFKQSSNFLSHFWLQSSNSKHSLWKWGLEMLAVLTITGK